MSPSKKTVALISGSNTGIGLAVAQQLAKDHGYHVIIASRNEASGKGEADKLVADGFAASSVQLDITSDDSITKAVSWIEKEFGVLDVLINNAAILLDSHEQYKDLTPRELFSQTLNTNVTGTACLTEACLPLLRKSEFARLIFVSSRMGSIQETLNKETLYYNTDYKAYDCSKAALNMLALNYARILNDTGVLVNVACPGLVKTKATAYHPYGTTTDVGAIRIVQLATAGKGTATATFTDRDGVIPW
ncbi:short chain dehydrogenase reductase [Microthyrium microscopicum]|uniref:Short chain dehydrogenase reductase n=1 Tax=Microthyrium microscopicum TaxID=703497 RepID=A0A6A6U0A5_9PEZI|nr:short chain dehydrogenase reductase [Microthyrium microscopicum]